MIKFENVFKYSKDKLILADICLQIEDGDFVCLLGEEGSGKTTLLNLIYGIDKPSEGKLLVEGIAINNAKKKEILFLRRKIGIIFQENEFFEHKTVFDNLYLPLCISQKISFSQGLIEVDKLLNILKLTEKREFYPSQLSFSEKKLLAIGRTLIGKKKIILADEPFSGLSQQIKENLIEIFKNINEQGTTLFFTTKDKSFADELGAKVVKINSGVILSDLQ